MDQRIPQRQAALLIALGEHVRSHGLTLWSLADVPDVTGDVDLQVPDPVALVAWARSAGVRELAARPLRGPGWCSVGFTTVLGGSPVWVWARVEGWPPDWVSLTLGELARFTDRSQPGRVGGESDG